MKKYNLNQINEKRILGRNVKNAGNSDKPLALFWGASALEVNVKSEEVWVQLSSDYDTAEPWVTIEINGAPVSRFMVVKGEPQWFCISRKMNPEKEALISIIKDTQPMTGEAKHSLFVHAVGLSDNGKFCKLKERSCNIEFIGDSITSGEGLAGDVEEFDWIPQWFCASKTYAMQICKKMNASWSVLSQCGWGICWGWDGNRNTVMPPHYDEVCSVMWGDYQAGLGVNDKYDFAVKNDYVILNLGTNDNGAFFQPAWKDEKGVEHVLHAEGNERESDGRVITEEVKAFLKNIRLHNPKAKIIWTWGMIKLVLVPEYIQKGIDEYVAETGDKKVYSLELPAMEDVEKYPEDKGSRGHPGPLTHKLAAERIVDFIKELQS